MCVSAAAIAAVKEQTVNAIAGTLTAYPEITALTTGRPPGPRSCGIAPTLFVTTVGLTTIVFGLLALASATGRKFAQESAR